MSNLLEEIKTHTQDSPFLQDILADVGTPNAFNVVYNYDPLTSPDSVLIKGVKVSDTRRLDTQVIKDLSGETFESIGSVVVQDTYPLGFGHVLCVPLTSILSFNQYLHSANIQPDKFDISRLRIAEYLRNRARLAGFKCDQVVIFEHGSGVFPSQMETYNACGTGVALCSTAVHAHLHFIPICNTELGFSEIQSKLVEVAGEEIFMSATNVDQAFVDLEDQPYFSLKLVNWGEGDSQNDILIKPDQAQLLSLPSQLWRRVIGPLVDPKVGVDLIDYKKLSQKTLGDLRSEGTINKLRAIHDRFWFSEES